MNFFVIIPSKLISNLVPCVQAVLRHEPNLNPANIIVVDDGLEHTDESWEAVGGCTFVQGVKPFVFAQAINRGIMATLPKFDVTCHDDREERFMLGQATSTVIAHNDDALLKTHEGFTLLCKALRENREYGLIGATTNITGQPLQFRREGGGIAGAGVRGGLLDGLRPVPHFAFICVAIPARTMNKVGLLDSRYSLDYGCDDADYCEAVTRAGFKVGVMDSVFVDHGSLTSTYRGDPKTPKSFKQNLGLLMQKWGRLMTQPGLRL
jgi:hypothetical protein